MNFDTFVGESYTSRALNFDAQRSMNLYLEMDESGAGKSNKALMGTPGLTAPLLTLGTSPIRGIWTGLIDTLPGTSEPDQMWAVAGSKLYSISSSWVASLKGDVGTDAANSPVQFAVNGSQLLISSAGQAWLWTGVLTRVFFNDGTGTVDTSGTAVTLDSGSPFDASQVGSYIKIGSSTYLIDAFIDESHITLHTSAGTQSAAIFYVLTGPSSTPIYVPAAQIGFLDTYFIALPFDSKIYYISAIDDGSSWSPLDFGEKSAWPDNIGAMLVDHEELWLLGTEKTEVHRDTGGSANSTFPFERDPGSFIHQGIRAPFGAVSLANGVAWIGGDERGGPIAWYAQGYVPNRISTHAIEAAWGEYSVSTDAVSFVYVQDGHQFWVISFPTANATWVYDATDQVWHERGWWNGTSIDRARYATHGYVFGVHVVGDWYTGDIYQLSLDVFTDNGTKIVPIRTAPHLSEEELWSFYGRFRLAMAGGPAPTLAWSDDLGLTYNAPRAGSSRRISSSSDSASQVSEFRRLGRARDRVFSVVLTQAAGTVNTSGTAVTFETGDNFANVIVQAGQKIQIAGTNYTIASVNSSTSLTLTGSAGTQTGAAFFTPPPCRIAITGAYLDVSNGGG